MARSGSGLRRAIMARMPSPRRAALFLLATLAPLAAMALTAGTASATNDQFWAQQWAPPKIGAPAAWVATTGAGVKIGIVDSGVDLGHQDLQGKIVANASCIGTDGDAARCVAGGGQDVVGHGTHVAGIAAANKDNGVGTAGIAPSAQLVVARVFQGDTAELPDVEAGIRWVVQQGARVVNLSLGENLLLGGLLGGGGGSLAPALNDAWARGAIPVVASGNAQLLSGSASYGDVNAVIVGATGPDDRLADYSVPTGSAKWAIVAPGGNGADGAQIFSTYWRPGSANQYAYLQGTSMATPHVSGALALLLARGVPQQRAVELLLASATRAVSCGATCAGRLDVAAAVAATGAALTPATTAATSPPPPPPTAAPTTASPRTRRTAAPPPSTTAPAPVTTLPPAPDTTTATAPPPTEATTPPAAPALEVAAAGDDDANDEVGLPAAAAALLLAGVAGAWVVLRRRTT